MTVFQLTQISRTSFTQTALSHVADVSLYKLILPESTNHHSSLLGLAVLLLVFIPSGGFNIP